MTLTAAPSIAASGHGVGWTRAARLLGLAVPFGVLLFLRKPRALLQAELWADDGWTFYPQAYMHGWRSLLIPYGGYLDTLQRLIALAAQPLPLTAVPTAFALAAFVVQLLPPVFLISDRMAVALPSWPLRLVLALLMVALPDEIEVFVNLTNTQWNLALLALLVVMGRPARSRGGSAVDVVVLTLSGLSGPFMLMLAPVAAWQAWRRPGTSTRSRLALIVVTAAIQVAVLLVSQGRPSSTPLGAGPRMLARVLSEQLVLAPEFGWRSTYPAQALAVWQDNLLPSLLTLGGVAVVALSLWRGPLVLRQLALFAGLMLAAALADPTVSAIGQSWEVMTHLPIGNRYFTVPVMTWIAMVLALALDRWWPVRTIGVLLLAPILLLAIPRDWSVLSWHRTAFQAQARAWAHAPAGTRMTFQIVPDGLRPMELVKRRD